MKLIIPITDKTVLSTASPTFSLHEKFSSLFPDFNGFPGPPSSADSLLNVLVRSSHSSVDPSLVAFLIRQEICSQFKCPLSMVYANHLLDDSNSIEIQTTSFPI